MNNATHVAASGEVAEHQHQEALPVSKLKSVTVGKNDTKDSKQN
jgi:hypothetical protein